MHYIVYEITNTINQKTYIGCHRTENIDDGYMGSGLLIRRAIEKHGIEFFTKRYIGVFDNPQEMFDLEKKLVTEDYLKTANTYNLKVGGNGGWDHLNDGSEEHIQRARRGGYVSGCKSGSALGKRMFREQRAIFSKEHLYSGTNAAKHPDVCAKRRATFQSIKHQQGSKNTQYGTKWITNPMTHENKKIHLTDVLPNGWVYGRKMK